MKKGLKFRVKRSTKKKKKPKWKGLQRECGVEKGGRGGERGRVKIETEAGNFSLVKLHIMAYLKLNAGKKQLA